MLATVTAGAVLGIDAYLVTIEADVSSGLPAFFLVGLPQGAVKEARERIIAAMGNSGYYVPPRRITPGCPGFYKRRMNARAHPESGIR